MDHPKAHLGTWGLPDFLPETKDGSPSGLIMLIELEGVVESQVSTYKFGTGPCPNLLFFFGGLLDHVLSSTLWKDGVSVVPDIDVRLWSAWSDWFSEADRIRLWVAFASKRVL